MDPARTEIGVFPVAIHKQIVPNDAKAQKYAKYGGRGTLANHMKMLTAKNRNGNTAKANTSDPSMM